MRRTALLLALLLPTLTAFAAAPTTQQSATQPAARPAKVNFSQVALEDVINHIRDATKANIHVNWRALALLNVTRQTQISITLDNVSVRRLLHAVLDETGAGQLLTFYVEDGVIEITTREMADSKLITKVYPVEDMVMEVPNFAGPSFNLQSTGQTSGGGGGGGGGGSGLLSNTNSNVNSNINENRTTKAERAEGLVTLIKETVRPEVWRDNGGTASIRYFNGHLIVTAPRSVHEALGGRL